MRFHRGLAPWASVAAVALVVGCSSNAVRLTPSGGVAPTSPASGSATATPTGSATATPTGSATATPTGSATATPTHTATPTPGHTTTPTPGHTATPTPFPTGTGGGGIAAACSGSAVPIPGNYLSIVSDGQVSGSTFTGDPAISSWEDDAYVIVPTPSPTPIMTATPIATATPTTSPVPTTTPVMISVYTGSYTVSSFSGSQIPEGGATPSAYTVQAQSGCFELALTQPVGGTIGQIRRLLATPNPSDNSFAFGFPNTGTANYQTTEIATGSITAFTINNLSVSAQSGSGTFTLDSGATGSVSITQAQSVTEQGFSRLSPITQRMIARQEARLSQRLHR